MPVTLEGIAYWYFRLNGCFTIPNFVVHPDQGRNQGTDVDVLAVRFPYRSENLERPMLDDPVILDDKLRIRLFLVEAKTGPCELNGPWTTREQENMQRVLRAVGIVALERVESVADSLYRSGRFQDTQVNISLFCIGAQQSDELHNEFPDIPQITWEDVTEFIYRRFRDYRHQKVSHPQWDEAGQLLWNKAMDSRSPDEFHHSILDT